jgi:hypothetical protein
VRVTLGLGPELGFHADIANCGEVSVYLKEVALDWDSGPKQTMRTSLLIATPLPAGDGKGPGTWMVLGHKNHDLPPGKEVRFVLPRFPVAVMEQVAALAPVSVSLRVFSYLGEIHQVRGDELQPVLVDLVKLWQSMEESGGQPTSRASRIWAFPLAVKKNNG